VALVGTGVWQQARNLFATDHQIASLPAPVATAQYNGDARRAAVAPTSK